MTIHITIPGKPIAKARPRFARRGKFVTTYSPQATEEGLWILTAREQLRGVVLDHWPLQLDMTFLVPRPKSHYGKNGVKPSAPKYPTSKPDTSNYIKFVEDCLNECGIWADDSVVVNITAQKRYANGEPKTEIEINKLYTMGDEE